MGPFKTCDSCGKEDLHRMAPWCPNCARPYLMRIAISLIGVSLCAGTIFGAIALGCLAIWHIAPTTPVVLLMGAACILVVAIVASASQHWRAN